MPASDALRRTVPALMLLLLAARDPRAAETAAAFPELDSDAVITGVTKRTTPLSEIPSSVTVITAAEIRAHGYHTLADALRWVRGFHISYDRNYSYLGVRGVQRPGDYNNKVLLTIDGHAMNGSVFGDAAFGEDLGLDMETVDRIEVVRGPGSALHGSYAVLAVVNVVTRRPESRPAIGATARLGSFGDRRAWFQAAGAEPGRPAWALSSSWTGMRGPDLYFAEYDDPFTDDGRAIDGDGEHAAAFFGVGEWGETRLVAKFNERMKRIPTGAYGVRFNDRRNRTIDGHNFVELSSRMRPTSSTELLGRAWWDGARYHGFFIYGDDTSGVVNFDRGDGDVVGTEWRLHWSPAERHIVTSGMVVRRRYHTRLINYDEDPFVPYTNVDDNDTRAALYLQDEVHLGPRGLATAGLRVDRHEGFSPVVSPRADLLWHLSSATTWKVLAGSAFRAPVLYETDYVTTDQIAAPDLDPERIVTVETEIERRIGAFTATVSGYRSWITDLIDLVEVDSTGTLQFRNRARVRSHGVETELRYVSPGGTRARFAAVLLDNNIDGTHTDLSNSPHLNAHLVVSHAPSERRASLGVGLRFLSARRTLSGAWTEAVVVADGRIGMRLPGRLQLGVEGRNLFNAHFGDPGSLEHLQDQIEQDGRTFFATLAFQP